MPPLSPLTCSGNIQKLDGWLENFMVLSKSSVRKDEETVCMSGNVVGCFINLYFF